MEIRIEEKSSEQQLKEFVNVVYYMKRLIKLPSKKITDLFMTCYLMIALAAVFTCVTITLLIIDKAPMLFTLLLAYVLIFVFYGKSLLGMKHMLRVLKENKGGATFRLTEEDVALVSDNGTTIQTAWRNVMAVREFNQIVVFLPKDETKMIICLDKKYAEQIEAFIREKEIAVQYIK